MVAASPARRPRTASAPGTPWPARCPRWSRAAACRSPRPRGAASPLPSRISRIFSRGSVTLRPALRRSFVAILGLSACVYRIPIQQGNHLDAETLAQVKPGMTHTQVRYLLGTPLVDGGFQNDRWDYVYYLRMRRLTTPQRRARHGVFSRRCGRSRRWRRDQQDHRAGESAAGARAGRLAPAFALHLGAAALPRILWQFAIQLDPVAVLKHGAARAQPAPDSAAHLVPVDCLCAKLRLRGSQRLGSR
jgi:hypothetical protein